MYSKEMWVDLMNLIYGILSDLAMTVVIGDVKLARYLVAGLWARVNRSRNSCSNSLKCRNVMRAYRDHVRSPKEAGDRFIN